MVNRKIRREAAKQQRLNATESILKNGMTNREKKSAVARIESKRQP